METSKITIRMTGDVRVSVPSNGQLMTTYVLHEQEDWFEDEIRFLRKLVRPGMLVIDIGANYGLYSLSLARVLGEGGRVVAVEPCAATASHLRESLVINQFHQITVVQSALSNKVGTARLQTGANSELNSLVSDGQFGASSEEVDLTTLDRLAEEYGCDGVDFIKMDAEGEEERIIEGGRQFFQTQSPLVMYEIKSGDKINLGLVGAFAALGYASFRLVPGIGMLVPFDAAGKLEAYQLNLFCCKPDRAAALARDGVLAMGDVEAPPLPEAEHWWRNDLAKRPFARGMQDSWFSTGRASSEGVTGYDSILSLYGAAHDPGHDASKRHAALREAFERLTALFQTDRDPYHLSTYARIAREFGERQVAVSVIGRALQSVTQADPDPPGEPFLPASEHFDDMEPAGKFRAWLLASLLDQGVSLYTFSTYFAPGDLLQSLEMLKSTGFQRPEMERRRQLMRMRSNLQPAPEPDSCLVQYHAGNLNPEFWVSKSSLL